MSNKVTIIKESKEVINLNKQSFLILEPHWATVRIGYIRDLPLSAKDEIERIYKQEIEPTWLPNKWCNACYFDAIQRLIKWYEL
jgi:hypothetical protein